MTERSETTNLQFSIFNSGLAGSGFRCPRFRFAPDGIVDRFQVSVLPLAASDQLNQERNYY